MADTTESPAPPEHAELPRRAALTAPLAALLPVKLEAAEAAAPPEPGAAPSEAPARATRRRAAPGA